MLKPVTCLAALLTATAAVAQDTDEPQFITFEGKSWRITAQDAHIERHLGRTALSLSSGRVRLDDADFGDGVIEFDIAYDEVTGFAGAGWRAQDDGHYEELYLRPHLDEKPDAVQYTPVINRLSAWQIFSDGNAQTALKHNFDGWNHVKIVVEGDKADLYFNSDTPSLHIPDLKGDYGSGGVNLRANGPDGFGAYFSNVEIRPLRDAEGVVGTPKESTEPPEGVITSWTVSSSIDEAVISDKLRLDSSVTDDLEWGKIAVETNGIANLAKRSPRTRDANTVFVRANLKSDGKQMKELSFGYSDRVRIYLNGKRVFAGDAGWSTRDYRFLGTVGFQDSVGLDLKKGDNELLVAVSEGFGGWAWAGAIKDQSDLSISD